MTTDVRGRRRRTVTGAAVALALIAVPLVSATAGFAAGAKPETLDSTSSSTMRVGPAAMVGAGAAPQAGVGVLPGVQEALSNYSGKWSQLSSRSDSGGASDFLNTAGSASLTFDGDSVRWLSRITPSAGIANVYLDGVLAATVDRYSTTTQYQKTVFSRDGLGAGEHTITIEWSGKANPASSDRNLVIDAVVVPDTVAPLPPTGVTATLQGGQVAVGWTPVEDWSTVSYRIERSVAGSDWALVGKASVGTSSFLDLGVPSATAVSYRVTAVDGWANRSAPSTIARPSSGSTASGHRYANCPAATVTVSTRKQLEAAAKAAAPGSVIRLAPGTWPGQLDITAKGTADKPVWICGSRDVVINGGGYTVNSPINVAFSSHLIVTGMTATNALKGVTVRASDHVTISDMAVTDIGYEGIHLRSHTTDSTVIGNTVSHTGRLDPFYGEGVYIGSSKNNWCTLTDCLPDRSDRNAVLSNTIHHTGSDLIEAKEGTTGGLIAGNTLDGTGAMPRTESWVMVSGNDWIVTGNSGITSSVHGFRLNGDTPGWGLRALFAENSGQVNASGYGFKVWEPEGSGSTDSLITCSNRISGAASGFSNILCLD